LDLSPPNLLSDPPIIDLFEAILLALDKTDPALLLVSALSLFYFLTIQFST